MSGSEHARPVWLDKADEQVIEFIYQRAKAEGDVAMRSWAANMHARVDAAPADPTEAIGLALRDILAPHRFSQRTDLTWDLSRAVLEALGCAKDPA